MLVVLGPGFAGTERELVTLAEETGLTPYDLRARLRPGAWGVLRVIAADEQAEGLIRRLRQHGLPACGIPVTIGQDVARRIVYLRRIRFLREAVLLRLAEREMTVPNGALLVIVRGEVHVGRTTQASSPSASGVSIRPTSATVGLRASSTVSGDVFREPRSPTEIDVFAAADLHFATVPWVARIDARELDFPEEYLDIPNLAERLDRFVDDLARRASIRVDRCLRTSSLASHTVGSPRAATPLANASGTSRRSLGPSDDHFDAYSRLVAEAERQLAGV
ncbi:MAG: hypothetical protein QM784_37685 [Polyangiaceae bacterium]